MLDRIFPAMSVGRLARIWGYILVCAVRGWLFRFRRSWGWSVHDRDAIESLYDALDPRAITYSQVWEDVRTLRKALSLSAGDRTLIVCSGGDNALALLLDNPELVLAVDYSPAQVAVAELKKQAIRTLDYDTFMHLLGVTPAEGSTNGHMSRVQIYEKLLRPHLGYRVCKFWDHHKDQLQPGMINMGIYEEYFNTFGRAVVPLVHSVETIHGLLSLRDPEAQREYYDNVIDTCLWRLLVRLYFGDVLVGRCPAFYERSTTDVGGHFLSRLRHVMRNVPAHDNFYLEYVLTGKLTSKFSLPEYMQAKNFEVLRERVSQLVVVEGDILNVLEKSESQFDAIDISNIFDFVPQHDHERYREAVMARSHSGTRVVHWTFVPVAEHSLEWQPFGKGSRVDKETSIQLNNLERAWFYQTMVVQRIEFEGEQGKHKPHTNGHSLKNGTNGINGKNGVSHRVNGTNGYPHN